MSCTNPLCGHLLGGSINVTTGDYVSPKFTVYRGFKHFNGRSFYVSGLRSSIPDDYFKELIKDDLFLCVPCNRCSSCSMDYSRDWSIRGYLESLSYEKTGGNSFITLTYDSEHLNSKWSLSLFDLQSFIKRLRFKVDGRVRYIASGEYSPKNSRPHYHLIIFNYDFPDKFSFKVRDGITYYRSPLLESIWDKGFSVIGSVNINTVGYVARYVLKKRGVKTGQISKYRLPEFMTSSRRPGIAYDYFQKNWKEIYVHDGIRVPDSDKFIKPPRYFDKLLMAKDMSTFLDIKRKRFENQNYLTLSELYSRDYIVSSRTRNLQRVYEGAHSTRPLMPDEVVSMFNGSLEESEDYVYELRKVVRPFGENTNSSEIIEINRNITKEIWKKRESECYKK